MENAAQAQPEAPTGTAIVPQAPAGALAASPMTGRAAILRAQLDVEDETRKLIKIFVEKHMVEGVDYGVVPGTKKKSLLKPGSEKLIDLFRVEPVPTVEHRIEDWDKPLFHYEIRCELKDRETKTVLAVGMGSANTREGRYRWRQAERVCPACKQPAIIKGKAEYRGGWVCFKKKGGCGEKYADDAAAIVDQPVGKVENDDVFTLVNTVLKMAKKRAQVDAAIALARCSDMFTQDVEDLDPGMAGDERAGNGDASRDARARAAVDAAQARELDPGDFEITFGKNKGKRLRELSIQQLQWYADESKNPQVRQMAGLELEAREERAEQRARAAVDSGDTNSDWGLE